MKKLIGFGLELPLTNKQLTPSRASSVLLLFGLILTSMEDRLTTLLKLSFDMLWFGLVRGQCHRRR